MIRMRHSIASKNYQSTFIIGQSYNRDDQWARIVRASDDSVVDLQIISESTLRKLVLLSTGNGLYHESSPALNGKHLHSNFVA